MSQYRIELHGGKAVNVTGDEAKITASRRLLIKRAGKTVACFQDFIGYYVKKGPASTADDEPDADEGSTGIGGGTTYR